MMMILMKRPSLWTTLAALWIATPLPVQAEKVGPWDLDELYQTPAMHWVKQDAPIQQLLYTGEVYKGHPTEVFAFYASPTTLGDPKVKPGTKFPGVVLIHGGGGTAFADWAYLWAKRGYAAIAMDLSGRRPPDPVFDPKTGAPVGHQSEAAPRTRLANGGPEQGGTEKFASISGPVSEQWPFHAAASVIRAHSLLRSFAEVDAEHTAVTGISWGGYTTCLVASLDARFKAAVPVYGCGFLFEGESVQRPSIDALGDNRAKWIREYDPSSLLPRCRIPILFVNGTNDVHYTLDSYQKSFDAITDSPNKQLRIEVNMRHGHPPGWAPQEIGLFIDTYCRGGQPLPRPGKIEVTADHQVRVPYTGVIPLKDATLHYTTDTRLRSKRTWKSLPAKLATDAVTAPAPPADANTWYVSLFDERGALVTTEVQFNPKLEKSSEAK